MVKLLFFHFRVIKKLQKYQTTLQVTNSKTKKQNTDIESFEKTLLK